METQIKNRFEHQKQTMRKELDGEYSNIVSTVVSKGTSALTQNIAIEESSKTTEYLFKLTNDVKKLTLGILRECGVYESESEILWTKIRLAVPMPKIEYCKEIPKGSTTDSVRPKPQENQKKGKTITYGSIIMVGGIALEVLGWLVIPGFKAIAAITKTMGLVLIGTGGYVMYKEKHAEKVRIQPTPEVVKQKTTETVSEICKKQYNLNVEILSAWIDKIYTELCNICNKMSK